jgi:hypothetical protein
MPLKLHNNTAPDPKTAHDNEQDQPTEWMALLYSRLRV